MIPDEKTIKALWDTYHLPSDKRMHCEMVAKVASAVAKKLKENNTNIIINEQLIFAAALLHDIDKNIEKLPGEHHPDAGVRVLKQEGMDEVAEVIRTHPLHMILDVKNPPKTIEQKILFISDKMTRYECIGIEKRFLIWKKEDYDEESQAVLDASYPKVISLRDEILSNAGITEEDIAKMVK
ncbi:HD domain-containing protein [Patescibacteria group bacterium]|nr:HD domain-containing protein [Patescibacteria group bacterium]